MDTLNIYLNELKQNSIPKYILIGISSKLILEKSVFKKNEDLKEFIFNSFLLEEQYKQYVYDSRTTLLAKVARRIESFDEKQTNETRKKLLSFLRTFIENDYRGPEKNKSNSSKVIWD